MSPCYEVPMRHCSPRARWALAPVGLAALLGCGKRDEPPPTPPAATSATSADVPVTPANGHQGPRSPRKEPPQAPDNAAGTLPTAMRDPTWNLDPTDPARDYVARYVRATKRYGDVACVSIGKSTFANDRSTVEARNDTSGACGKAGDLRDRFLVNVATDRMSIDGALHQPALSKWPDGSDPDGPPGKVADVQDLLKWKTPLHDAFHTLLLAPLRMQLYGRGTYPIFSIAGWHGPVMRNMTPAQLEAPARALCDANEGAPLGIFAGFDRSTLLRIDCPASAHFETL